MKLALLAMVMLFGAVFLVIPENNNAPTYALFPFMPQDRITVQSYVYFIFEHFTVMALSYIVAVEARVYRLSCKTFFWIQVADFTDYMLTYNAVWFHFGLLPVSMNLVRVMIFIFVAMYDYHHQALKS